jgi:hypothetical protein
MSIRDRSSKSMLRTVSYESIDRYFRTIEQSPGLWLNHDIELNPNGHAGDATTRLEDNIEFD